MSYQSMFLIQKSTLAVLTLRVKTEEVACTSTKPTTQYASALKVSSVNPVNVRLQHTAIRVYPYEDVFCRIL